MMATCEIPAAAPAAQHRGPRHRRGAIGISYGFLSEAQANKIDRYQLSNPMDERTSKICRELNGREFEVDRSMDYMESILEATDPESLKSLAPFVDGSNAGILRLEKMSDEELQAAGVMVPPFHVACYSYDTRVYTKRGFVLFADVDIPASGHRNSAMSARQGANPIPSSKMVINLKTARALGLTVPPTLLATADEVIE